MWNWLSRTALGQLCLLLIAAGVGWIVRTMFGDGAATSLGWFVGFVVVAYWAHQLEARFSKIEAEAEDLRQQVAEMDAVIDRLCEGPTVSANGQPV